MSEENKIMIGNTILPMLFIFFTQVLLLKTNEYKARKKFKNLQLVGLIKYIKNDLIKNMAIEQTLFSIQRSVLQPEAVPALFSQYQWLLSDLFYNSDCTSCRNVNSALPLGIQFQDNISFLYRNSGMNPLQME